LASLANHYYEFGVFDTWSASWSTLLNTRVGPSTG